MCYTDYMKITKFGHACILLETPSTRLLIDPGVVSDLPDDLLVDAVVITHEHPDHLDANTLTQLLSRTSGLKIYTLPHQSLADMPAESIVHLHESTTITVGDFSVAAQVVDHAPLYQSSPCKNLTLTINQQLYYPGDSFALPEGDITTLLLPISGPWLNLQSTIDFVLATSANSIIPTHDGLLNEFGTEVTLRNLTRILTEKDRKLIALRPRDSLEIYVSALTS